MPIKFRYASYALAFSAKLRYAMSGQSSPVLLCCVDLCLVGLWHAQVRCARCLVMPAAICRVSLSPVPSCRVQASRAEPVVLRSVLQGWVIPRCV